MLTWTKRLFFTGTVLALLVTNTLTLTSTAFNAALSGAISTVLGVRTVADVFSQQLAGKDKALQRAQTNTAKRRLAAKKFGTRLTSRTRRVATRSVAAIPAESIPYIGIATVLAATSYELYEACQTLKDLNELYVTLELKVSSSGDTLDAVCNPQLPSASNLWESAMATKDQWIGTLMN